MNFLRKWAAGAVIGTLLLLCVPSATAAPTCTKTGTSGRDRISGTRHRDVICLRAGSDYGNGRLGSDAVRGGSGADTLVGGNGSDLLRGYGGSDDLFATDESPNDTLDGGPGQDNCYGDRQDTFRPSCEHIVRV